MSTFQWSKSMTRSRATFSCLHTHLRPSQSIHPLQPTISQKSHVLHSVGQVTRYESLLEVIPIILWSYTNGGLLWSGYLFKMFFVLQKQYSTALLFIPPLSLKKRLVLKVYILYVRQKIQILFCFDGYTNKCCKSDKQRWMYKWSGKSYNLNFTRFDGAWMEKTRLSHTLLIGRHFDSSTTSHSTKCWTIKGLHIFTIFKSWKTFFKLLYFSLHSLCYIKLITGNSKKSCFVEKTFLITNVTWDFLDLLLYLGELA